MKYQHVLICVLAFVSSASSVFAEINVTFYGPGAQSPSTNPATPAGIDIGNLPAPGDHLLVLDRGQSVSLFAWDFSPENVIFTHGEDFPGDPSGDFSASYFDTRSDSPLNQATVDGVAKNYANISFNGGFEFEAVGEFILDSNGGSYLNALAINDEDVTLPISQGRAAILAAVPEPASLSSLLSAVLVGLWFSRSNNRKKQCADDG